MSSTVRFTIFCHISTFRILYLIVLFNKLPFQKAITLQNIPTHRSTMTLELDAQGQHVEPNVKAFIQSFGLL